MDFSELLSTKFILNVFLWFVHVNGYELYTFFPIASSKENHSQNNETYSPNFYINVLYKLMSKYEDKFHHSTVTDNDILKENLEEYHKNVCVGYGALGGFIAYEAIDPQLHVKRLKVIDIYCLFPDDTDPDKGLFRYNSDGLNVPYDYNKLLDDLENYTRCKCKKHKESGLYGVYIAPNVSKSKSVEMYLGPPKCNLNI